MDRSKLDSLWIGLVVGIFVPVLSLLMFYYSTFTKVSFMDYSLQVRILPKIISLCVIPNLGVFFLFIWRNHYYSARGIILATVIITLVVLVLKIFL